MPDQMAEPAEVAAYYRKSEKTLANWRSAEIGPPWYKVNGRVLYDWADVRAWLSGRRVTASRP
jgi:hypothetical protein